MGCTLVRFTRQENCDLEELVHRPGSVLAHILENVIVAPEGHGRVGVAEHLGDSVKRHTLAES